MAFLKNNKHIYLSHVITSALRPPTPRAHGYHCAEISKPNQTKYTNQLCALYILHNGTYIYITIFQLQKGYSQIQSTGPAVSTKFLKMFITLFNTAENHFYFKIMKHGPRKEEKILT